MKGIIAEIHSSYMIVITKNGDFIKCKKHLNCNIGDEINVPAKNMKAIYKKLSAVAASFLILTMLSSGVYAYYTPYSYVSIDINPSLELYVNRFDKVIGVHAFNEEAQQVIDASERINNKDIDTALKQILDVAAEAGYLKENTENSVMIVVSSSNTKEEAALTDKITKTSTAVLSNISSNYEVILEKTKIENYKKAKEQNISPGKVILANQLKKVKPEIDEEETKRMTLQQAINQIEDKVEEDKKGEKDDKDVKEDKKDDKDDKDDKDKNSNKPTSTTSEKPKQKTDLENNVMNIRELIKEKNKELGNKLENDNNNKNKEKDKQKDKDDKDKSAEDESFNEIDDKDNKDNEDKQQKKDEQDDKSSKDKSNEDEDPDKEKDNKEND